MLESPKLETPVANQIHVLAKPEIKIPVFPNLQNPEIKKTIINLIEKNHMKLF